MNRQERRKQEKKGRLERKAKRLNTRNSNPNAVMNRSFNFALTLQQAGRLAEAEKAWEDLRLELPNHEGVNVNLATVLWRQGRMAEAEAACRRAVETNPETAEGLALLGVVCRAQGDGGDAIKNLEKAVAIKPHLVTAWLQLASLYQEQDNLDSALIACESAEALEPERSDILNILGLVFKARREWDRAERALRKAAAGAPRGQLLAEIQTNLAGIFIDQEDYMKAADCCREALEAYSIYPQAYNILGVALKNINDLNGARTAFKKAFKLDPKMAEARINLGTVLGICGEWDGALRCYDQALEINPVSAQALSNRGNAFSSLGRYNEAIKDFEQAIEIDNNYADSHFNLAFELLIQGRWSEGWSEFEWRWKTSQMKAFRRSFSVSKWDGRLRPTAKLLVYAEQGLGDTLNFVRYLPMAAARVGKLIFQCQPSLLSLLSSVDGIDEILASNEVLPDFNLHIPLLSLPGIFETTPETVPNRVPYIHASEKLYVPLPEEADGLKVGIVWAGNPDNPVDSERTIGLAPLKKLLEVRGCIFYSLQHGEQAKQIAEERLESRIQDLNPLIEDFATTASLVVQLDLVISICTSVAHLAGSMGIETWILLSRNADWRWMRGRDDTPWYPSVRLFRQKKLHNWTDLVDQVAQELGSRVASGCLA